MAVNIGPRIQVDGEKEYRQSISNIIQQAKTLSSQMKVVTAGFNDNTTAQEKAKRITPLLSEQIKVQEERVEKLKEMLQKSTEALGENDTKTLKWQQAVNEATAELRQLENQLEDTTSDLKKAADETGDLGDESEKTEKKAGKLGNTLKTVLASAAKAVVSTIAAAAAGIVALGKIGIEYNMEMESYTANFETMLGDAEAAAEKVNSLKELAAKTPFEMTDLADATQQLLAMGVANEDTNKYLQQLGDISLGDSQKLQSLIGAFGKMNSSGKVTLEYINMMAEQGFNPLNQIAKITGETMTELYERVSDGGVSFQEIKLAISAATSAGGQFYKGMDKASKTTKGLIATLKDNATALVGEVFTPISEGLLDQVLPGAISAIDQLSAAFKENGVTGMVEAAGDIIGDTLGQFSMALPDFVDTAVDIVKSLISGIKNNLDDIAGGAVSVVTTLIEGFADMVPDIIVTGVMLIGKLAAGLIEGLPDLIASIPTICEEIAQTFVENADVFKQIGTDIANGIWDGLEKMFDWLVDNQWFTDAVQAGINGFMGAGIGDSLPGVYAFNGSHAGGLNYVPFDGYIAKLHQGEMVLTRSQANYLRGADSGMYMTGGSRTVNYGGVAINIYPQPGQDASAIADEVMIRIQTEIEQKGAGL